MRWRPALVSLHRDVGFLCVGLTLAYAVSGIAVNHAHHWNYNRSESEQTRALGTPANLIENLPAERRTILQADAAQMTREEEQSLVRKIGAMTGRSGAPRNVFWRGPDEIRMFWGQGDDDTVEYRTTTGAITQTVRKDRWVLRDLHFLHLNEGRGVWTYLADAYAVLLLFLAVSGTIVVRGRRGWKGRGGVLLGVGVLIPIVALVVMRWV